jgi:hypothetical protein
LYDEPTAKNLDLSLLAAYLRDLVSHLQVDVRDAFVSHALAHSWGAKREKWLEQLALALAQSKVPQPNKSFVPFQPLAGEVDYELRRLKNPVNPVFGILYDGWQLLEVLRPLIPRNECSLAHIHVIFTNQLFGTWDKGDRRYHARANLCSYPAVISTTGLVEAPAKPRQYYFLKQQYLALHMDDAAEVASKEEVRGRFIDHDDERLTEVAKGYILQALFYHVFGEAFCDDPDCRLFNAHWQEELIRAQLGGVSELCQRHQAMIENLARDQTHGSGQGGTD